MGWQGEGDQERELELQRMIQYLGEKLDLFEVCDDLKRYEHLRVHLTDEKLVHRQVARAEIKLDLLPDGLQESIASQISSLRRTFTSADIRHYNLKDERRD